MQESLDFLAIDCLLDSVCVHLYITNIRGGRQHGYVCRADLLSDPMWRINLGTLMSESCPKALVWGLAAELPRSGSSTSQQGKRLVSRNFVCSVVSVRLARLHKMVNVRPTTTITNNAMQRQKNISQRSGDVVVNKNRFPAELMIF